MSAVVLEDVTVRFRGAKALADVSTAFTADTITGLLGRNGAGKTTLMQLVTGHRVPTSGTVRVFGEPPFENDGVLPRICFVKESQRYPDHFRVVDAITAASRLFPEWDGDLAASLLADYAEQPRTVVLSTHLIEEIGDLLEHVVLLDHGRVVVDEDAERLRSSALTVSGPTSAVDAAVRNYEVLHRESLAGRTRVMVRTMPGVDVMMSPGVTLEPVNLQQLVVAMSRRDGEPDLAAAHLEEFAR